MLALSTCNNCQSRPPDRDIFQRLVMVLLTKAIRRAPGIRTPRLVLEVTVTPFRTSDLKSKTFARWDAPLGCYPSSFNPLNPPSGVRTSFSNGPSRLPFRHISAVQSRHESSHRLACRDRSEAWICSVPRFESRYLQRKQYPKHQSESLGKPRKAIRNSDLPSQPKPDHSHNSTSHEYCGMACGPQAPSPGSKVGCYPFGEFHFGEDTMLPMV